MKFNSGKQDTTKMKCTQCGNTVETAKPGLKDKALLDCSECGEHTFHIEQ